MQRDAVDLHRHPRYFISFRVLFQIFSVGQLRSSQVAMDMLFII
jgi:hypothetical protein